MHKAVVCRRFVDFGPDTLEGFGIMERAILKIFVFPVAGSEPAEEGTECGHAGGDESEIVLYTAIQVFVSVYSYRDKSSLTIELLRDIEPLSRRWYHVIEQLSLSGLHRLLRP